MRRGGSKRGANGSPSGLTIGRRFRPRWNGRPLSDAEVCFLPEKFLVDVAEYFREKKEFLAKEDDLFSDMAIKNKKKLENAISSFRDLLRIRKKKILNLAFSK